MNLIYNKLQPTASSTLFGLCGAFPLTSRIYDVFACVTDKRHFSFLLRNSLRHPVLFLELFPLALVVRKSLAVSCSFVEVFEVRKHFPRKCSQNHADVWSKFVCLLVCLGRNLNRQNGLRSNAKRKKKKEKKKSIIRW